MTARDSSAVGLTGGQLGIWTGHQLSADPSIYNVAEAWSFEGAIDGPALLWAIESAVARCESLHRRFEAVDDRPIQVALPADLRSVEVERVECPRGLEPWSVVAEFSRLARTRVVDLASARHHRSVLFEISPTQWIWYFQCHHIALDGVGFSLLFRAVCRLYRQRTRGRVEDHGELGRYTAWLLDELDYPRSPAWHEDRGFWRDYLREAQLPASWSSSTPTMSAALPRRKAGRLDDRLMAELGCIARRAGATWPQAMIAAFADFTAEYHQRPEAIVGVPLAGRNSPLAAAVPAMVMNILPVRLEPHRQRDPLAAVSAVARDAQRQKSHTRYRYEDMQVDARRSGREGKLFGPSINILPLARHLRVAGLEVTQRRLSAGPVEDLALAIVADPLGRQGRFEFDMHPAQADAAGLARTARSWSTHLEAWLGRAAPKRRASPVNPVSQPPRSTDARFRCHVHGRPRATAIQWAHRRLSYDELDRQVEAMLQRLRGAGVRAGHFVLLWLDRGPIAVIAMLACQRLGAAHVPLGKDAGVLRNAEIATELGAQCIVCTPETQRAAAELARRTVTFELLDEPLVGQGGDECSRAHCAELPAYVMYTSGSTGRPNGVAVPRLALAHFVAAAHDAYGIGPSDRVLQFAPLNFDASVEEIFVTLCAGATLVIRADDELDSIRAFLDRCRAREISVLDLPTAFFHELCYALDVDGVELPACVHTIIIGGEAVSEVRLGRFWAAVGTGIRVINTYGPTETTVVATYAVLEPSSEASASIGRALTGVTTAIVDPQLRPVPRGEAGELCILGPTLATGYLHRPALNTKKFIAWRAGDARRAYRTGDVVRELADGQLAYEGRIDYEIKISGFRIHPREIENALLEHPAVVDACVVASATSQGPDKLVAFVQGQAPPDELRALAKARLIPAAIPREFVFVPALPKSAAGKVDRKSLEAELAAQSTTAELSNLSGEGSSELRALAEIWSEILGVHIQSRDADFFELGGASLQSLQVATRASRLLGRPVDAGSLLRNPRLEHWWASLRACKPDDDRAPPLERMTRDAIWKAPRGWHPGPSHADGAILLTGATGFIGGQLLRFCLASDAAVIYCLVRGENVDRARRRLRDHARTQGWLDAGMQARFDARVRVVLGDLALPNLGLSSREQDRLEQSCGLILHCAAQVHLMRDYAGVRASNVEALRTLIGMAGRGCGTSLHYLSTLAVAPPHQQLPTIPEVPLSAGPHMRDGYTQSKWVAETLLSAAFERGLHGRIYRLARVCPGELDSGVHAEDLFVRILAAGLRHGVLPRWQVRESWVPVDFAARSIVALARAGRSPGQSSIVHVSVPGQLAWSEIFEWVRASGYDCELLEFVRWRERMVETNHADDGATMALISGLSTGQHDPGAIWGLGRVDALWFSRGLRDLGIERPVFGEAQVRRLLGVWAAAGIIPTPEPR